MYHEVERWKTKINVIETLFLPSTLNFPVKHKTTGMACSNF